MKLFVYIAAIWLSWQGIGRGEEDPGFEKASLGWRTALHFDPGAEAPLQLLQMPPIRKR